MQGDSEHASDAPAAPTSAAERRRKYLRNTALASFRYLCHHFSAIVLLPVAILSTVQTCRARAWLHDAAERVLAGARLDANQLRVLVGLQLLAAAVLAAGALWLLRRRRTQYLLDFYTFSPPARMAVFKSTFLTGAYTPDSLAFMDKIIEKSGLGEGHSGYLPDEVIAGQFRDIVRNNANRRAESEAVLVACMQHVLYRTGLRATEIDAVVTNMCTFAPTPSLSALLVHRFGMRPDTLTYSLGGMGCSAGVVAIDLAHQLMRSKPGIRVLVAGTENILDNLYFGNAKSMLVTNCLFRLGGVAALLSNRPGDARAAKYRLDHVVRTHLGADPTAYNCVMQLDDAEGVLGMKIGRDIMAVAGRALRTNITALAPLVLPASEQLLYAGNLFARKVLRMRALKPYAPDFSTAFEHFCIHPGGKAVISEVSKQLKLRPEHEAPMIEPFLRFGNTSSSSTWYAWGYVESRQGVRRGDRLWQLSFGSGFKCNSATWTALRDCNEQYKVDPDCLSAQHDAWTNTPSID